MNEIISTAGQAASAAADIIMKKFGKGGSYEKTKNNLVTEADLEAEEAIVALIEKKFPLHQVLAEERRENTDTLAGHLWIVDPLDGTNNYAHGIPHFCVSIAYAEKGEVMAGVIYDPVRNELFCAEKGKGAFLNDKKIAVSNTARLSESIITTGFYYDRGALMEKTIDTVRSLFKADIRGIRRLGSAALDLCWVACGRFDGHFEYKLSPWDFAAGMLIIKEAGGKCSDRDGRDLSLTSKSTIVSNGRIHDDFLRIASWKE
ncbi:MAG TPA: inositol monophosphatase family protein [Chitinivibrionales bacterium]|nr:inositol monophosphatase family protein [Chitinivibrionales bacterium]